MIDKYSFGKIVIEGVEHEKDIEVWWDGHVYEWWRGQGHIFAIEDLDRALRAGPSSIILGTGVSGLAQVDPAITSEMHRVGIKLFIAKTKEAVKEFNVKQKNHEKVIGLFHITC